MGSDEGPRLSSSGALPICEEIARTQETRSVSNHEHTPLIGFPFGVLV